MREREQRDRRCWGEVNSGIRAHIVPGTIHRRALKAKPYVASIVTGAAQRAAASCRLAGRFSCGQVQLQGRTTALPSPPCQQEVHTAANCTQNCSGGLLWYTGSSPRATRGAASVSQQPLQLAPHLLTAAIGPTGLKPAAKKPNHLPAAAC